MTIARYSEEPYAGKPHVGICEGVAPATGGPTLMTEKMAIEIQRTTLERILPIRAVFLRDTNCQIRYNARHERGLTDSYAVLLGERMIGYGSVMGQELKERDTLFEYFLLPTYRNSRSEAFRELLDLTGVRFIECQSNDHHLSEMLFEFGENICSDTVLF